MVLLVLVVALAAALPIAWRWNGARSERPDAVSREVWDRRQRDRRRRRAQARLPALPAADAPPPGLGPLVPSPRAVRVEATRGISELEDWLADQASA